jgi:hypothetical protein
MQGNRYCVDVDYKQWAIRGLIIFSCAILGAVLAREYYKKHKRVSTFALFQIILSFFVPIAIGQFFHWRRAMGAGCEHDWFYITEDFMDTGSYSMLGLYIVLIISTIITIVKIHKLKKSSKSSK